MSDQEPFWATHKDSFGNPRGRYSWHGIRHGWSCHHCGSLFRGKAALLEHQARVLAKDYGSEAPKLPSERLSAAQIERAAQMLREYEMQYGIVIVPWENLNEKIKQHFRDKVRVVVDAVGEG